jgi:hypothetical protein
MAGRCGGCVAAHVLYSKEEKFVLPVQWHDAALCMQVRILLLNGVQALPFTDVWRVDGCQRTLEALQFNGTAASLQACITAGRLAGGLQGALQTDDPGMEESQLLLCQSTVFSDCPLELGKLNPEG